MIKDVFKDVSYGFLKPFMDEYKHPSEERERIV